ncbi:protein ALWAYS EARLY 3 [Sesamum alatum]|uniref:Protein ALWAYS EARLY 3 n=1 Tax=Sesamum alatum TaxID=300844 RepID=A0AAE1Y974_9LAMI|nr:protein ALWAYS EARLY 3 [Sesamum alatum]
MGPTRKSRSVNKRYSQVNEVSPSKDGDGSKRSNTRKRKLSDMLGPRWTVEELTRFYDSYRKNGKDWKKVATAVRNRSLEMVEALYTMNRAYLSLPHGTASAAGLIAMMTDHYCNLAGSDSDQESNDGVGSSQKTQKRARGKVPPPTSKPSAEQFVPHSPTIASNYGCLSLLKKKRSGGTRPRPVGKRTPRFPVSYSYANINGENNFSPTRQGLKLRANADDDEVAHEVAIALAEASQRGGSPQVSGTPCKRAESVMSSPFRHAERKHSVAELANAKPLAADTDEEDLEGSTEADTGELSGYKPYMLESVSFPTTRQKGTKVEGKKIEVDNNNESHLDNIKEECSGTEEGQRLGATRGKFDVEVNDTKTSRSFMQSQKKKSKKVLFGRDEGPAFDALQTLADLSLMMPTENEDESRVQFKDEHDDHVDESVPATQPREKRRSSGVRMKGHLVSSSEAASSKTSKPGKSSVFDVSSVPEETHDSHQPITKTTRKKQKMQVTKIQKSEAHPDVHLGESLGSEVGDAGKKLMTKTKKSPQRSSPKLMKISENSSSADLRKEGSDSAQSAIQVPVANQVNLPTKVRSRRKMNLKKPQIQKDLKFPDKISDDQSNLPFGSLHNTSFNLKEKLSNCLLNQRLRRWCTYEWFYSAIDYPWFAKSEFVEYLYHVGLGHVPRLTRVEWGVIRSSLGKPRRFSGQFLKEEKEKLNQYRDSVRKHYTELREGIREGLPTDLARPLSVGQRVIAIHPKTREIHDGSVLTVDHSKCRIQFDRHELGVEFVMDIDCMPLNPLENMPALLGRHTVAVDKSFENFNELQINGQAKEYIKLSPGDNLDSTDDISQLPPLANSASLLNQTKVASANANNVQTRIGPADTTTYQQIAYSQPITLAQVQAKEADVQALAELTRALDKKEAIVLELRRMNDDVLDNQKDANEQVSSALHCLRGRNTYQGKCPLTWPRPVSNHADAGGTLNSSDRSAYQTEESGSNVNEIMDSSRTKARKMVDAAMQASDPKLMNSSDVYTQIPSELITKCVATLLMIQKCTERQFPPSDVAQILDSAVTSLQPHSSQNLPVYTEIQKCVGIIKNQILALIPT